MNRFREYRNDKAGYGMKISTRGKYGLRAMIDLALYSEQEAVSISSIAFRQNISESYLEQLMAKLKKAGLVRSTRGAQGGYRLVRPPAEITVGEVLRALEGGLNLVDCLLEEDSCGKSCACPSRIVWMKIRDGLNNIVDGISLQDMIDEYAALKAQGEEQ